MKFILLLCLSLLVVASDHDDHKFLEPHDQETHESEVNAEEIPQEHHTKSFEDIMKYVRNPWKNRHIPDLDCLKTEGKDCMKTIRMKHGEEHRPDSEVGYEHRP